MENRSISSQFRTVAGAFKKARAMVPFLKHPVLVVVMGPFSVQGIVVERKDAARFTISRFLEVSFEASVRSPKARMARLMESLGTIGAKDVLVVTEEVRFLAADLPLLPARRFGGMDMEKLKEGARWEIAPFLDYPAENALINLVLLPEQDGDDFDTGGFSDEATSRRPALIFAVAPSVYAGFAAICKAYNKRLIGLMAEESFAFASGDGFEQEKDILVMECRIHDIFGALIRNGLPIRFQRNAIEGGETVGSAIQRLSMELGEDSYAVEEIVVGGEYAEKGVFPEIPFGKNHAPIRAWCVEDDLPFLQDQGPLPARYMAGMGAVLNFFDKKEKQIRIDDSVPFRTRLKENVHTLPLVLLIVFMIGIGGAYAHLTHKRTDLQQRIASLETEKKKLKADADNESSLKTRYRRLKNEKAKIRQKTDLILKIMPGQNQKIVGLLDGIVGETPADIHLGRLYQFSDVIFFVEGRTVNFSSITQYVVNLKNLPIVKEVRLENSQETEASAAAGKKTRNRALNSPTAVYQFSIRIRLES